MDKTYRVVIETTDCHVRAELWILAGDEDEALDRADHFVRSLENILPFAVREDKYPAPVCRIRSLVI